MYSFGRPFKPYNVAYLCGKPPSSTNQWSVGCIWRQPWTIICVISLNVHLGLFSTTQASFLNSLTPVKVWKWAQVRKGIYEGDVGFITSIKSGGVEILLVPHLSGNLSPSHSCSVPTLFKSEAVNRLYNIRPVEIQENIYSFRGDKFEHGLIIKSYSTDSISMTVSCIPFELFCLFLESRHPTLMAARSSFPKPVEWLFAEGDEVCMVDNPDKGFSY